MKQKSKRDFLSITDINEAELWQILKLAKKMKSFKGQTFKGVLSGKTLAMIFEKSSTRTPGVI